jgi:hypothetical protein
VKIWRLNLALISMAGAECVLGNMDAGRKWLVRKSEFLLSLARSAQRHANCPAYATINTSDGDYLVVPCVGVAGF